MNWRIEAEDVVLWIVALSRPQKFMTRRWRVESRTFPSIVAFYYRYKFLPETTGFTFPFKQTLLKRVQEGNFCEYTIATIYQTKPNQTKSRIKTYQNISLSDGSLDVSDNWPTRGTTTFRIHEFHSDLSDVTGVSGSSQDAAHFGKFDRGIL